MLFVCSLALCSVRFHSVDLCALANLLKRRISVTIVIIYLERSIKIETDLIFTARAPVEPVGVPFLAQTGVSIPNLAKVAPATAVIVCVCVSGCKWPPQYNAAWPPATLVAGRLAKLATGGANKRDSLRDNKTR